MIRVLLPYHLRTLAQVDGEIQLDVPEPVTLAAVLNALESRHPELRGTIRSHEQRQRRAFIRFFTCKEDLSNEPPDVQLPPPVVAGREPLLIVGAIAGG